MRKLSLLISFFLISNVCFSQFGQGLYHGLLGSITTSTPVTEHTYYVDQTGGNDANNGLTTATAWKTISKSNSTNVRGDTVLLKKGEVWSEVLIPPANKIYYSSYGSGAKPVLFGGVYLSSWSAVNDTVQEATLAAKPHLISVDGTNQAQGRLPKAGNTPYWAVDATTATSITSSNLSAYSLVGAQINVRKFHWFTYNLDITAQSTSTVTVEDMDARNGQPAVGNGYFIQNLLAACTTFGEWYWKSSGTKLQMFKGNSDLSGHTVIATSIDTLCKIGKDSITLNGLAFNYSNNTGITFETTVKGCTVTNCDVKFNGQIGIYWKNLTASTFSGNTIQNSNETGVYSDPNSNPNHISFSINNAVDSTGMLKGMWNYSEAFGASGCGLFYMYGAPDNFTVSQNTFTATGYIPIRYYGNHQLIEKNIIDYYCQVQDDGGAIYRYENFFPLPTPATDVILSKNFISHGGGNPQSTLGVIQYGNGSQSSGIYFDDATASQITADSNVISTVDQYGIFVHNSPNKILSGNVIKDCLDDGIFYGHDGLAENFPDSNIVTRYNTVTAQATLSETHNLLRYTDPFNDSLTIISWCGSWLNNYLISYPGTSHIVFQFSPSGSPVTHSYYTIAQWATAFNISLSGTTEGPSETYGYTPGTTRSDYLYFYQNPSSSPLTITVGANQFKAADGTVHNSNFSIPAWSGIILIRTNLP